LLRKASTFGDFGAIMPHPNTPILTATLLPSLMLVSPQPDRLACQSPMDH
jgi:hypothetical protein